MSKDFPYPFPERYRSRLMLHYRTRISGTEVRKKLPFRLLVLGDFTGPDAHAEPQNDQGVPKDPKAVQTVPALAARPIRSFRFGKAGGRVDDFMAELLPYVKLPKELATILPGRLKNVKLTGALSASTQAGEAVVKLSGTATFTSSKSDNGLCDVSGPVNLSADVTLDRAALPPSVDIKLQGGGKVRGLLTIPLKDEPVGVVAGVVRVSNPVSLQIGISDNDPEQIEATLNSRPGPLPERRERAKSDAEEIVKQSGALTTDAKLQTGKSASLTALTVDSAVFEPFKSVLDEAKKNLDALLPDATAAAAAYTGAAAQVEIVHPKATAAAGAAVDEATTKTAEATVRQARVVLAAVKPVADAAQSAIALAKSAYDATKEALDAAAKLAAETDKAKQVEGMAEVAQKVDLASDLIKTSTKPIQEAKGRAETEKKAVDDMVASFDKDAAANTSSSASADLPTYAERVLPFDAWSSFSPDEIVSNVPELNRLRVIRELLQTLQSEIRNVPALRDALRSALRDKKAELEALSGELRGQYAELVIANAKSDGVNHV
ncbi:type VI secretion system contractile sheath small subunit [Sorangium sp. So ce327]|uniref:type VI secretion system contractile sheath small subunit n=1 Tax=Sorangium sp. So ce327 TaxID=3133301 RepID=UPI003F60E84C